MIHTVDGTCYGLDSGKVTVRLEVHACRGYSVTESYARHKTSTSVIIMELTPQSVDTGKPFCEFILHVYMLIVVTEICSLKPLQNFKEFRKKYIILLKNMIPSSYLHFHFT